MAWVMALVVVAAVGVAMALHPLRCTWVAAAVAYPQCPL